MTIIFSYLEFKSVFRLRSSLQPSLHYPASYHHHHHHPIAQSLPHYSMYGIRKIVNEENFMKEKRNNHHSSKHFPQHHCRTTTNCSSAIYGLEYHLSPSVGVKSETRAAKTTRKNRKNRKNSLIDSSKL